MTNSFLSGRHRSDEAPKVPAGAQLRDAYPLYSTRGYTELNEIEAQEIGGGIMRRTDVSVVVESRVSESKPGVEKSWSQ